MVHEGKLNAKGLKFAIVISRFNSFITDRLLEGALDALKRHGAEENQVDIFRVPGAYEIPLAAKLLGKKRDIDAIICLGAVVKGATPHFHYVASEVAKGIAVASLESEKPITFGVITSENIEQAIERAGSKSGNKGYDAAMAAIEMANLFKGQSPVRRRKARELALRMLYQVETAGEDPELALVRYCEAFPYQQEIIDYTRFLLSGITEQQAAIDRYIEGASEHWKLGRTTYIDRSILRLGVYEMFFSTDVPPKVAIDEAIELGKKYGSEDSREFINGVLDRIFKEFYTKRTVSK